MPISRKISKVTKTVTTTSLEYSREDVERLLEKQAARDLGCKTSDVCLEWIETSYGFTGAVTCSHTSTTREEQ